MHMVLENGSGVRMILAHPKTVEDARKIWRAFAGIATVDVVAFEVWHDGACVYQGNYVTDEC